MKHGDEGYIIMKPPKDFNNFDFSFKFRSVHDDGLIVYSANVEQDQALSIGLLNGQIHVVLVPSRGSSVAVDTSRAGFADGFWHHVTVSLKKKKLVLVFDDNVEEKIEVDLRQKPKIKTTQMYFGGVPVTYPLKSENVPTTKRFKGCLADVSIDTKFQDFAAGPPESRVNVGLDQCLIPNLAPNPLPTVVVPTSQPSTGPPIKAPTNVGVADGGAEGEAAVSWEYIVDSGEIVTGYRVSYVLDDGIGVPGGISSSQWSEVDVGGGFRSTLIRNLVAGSAYIFRVSAINDFGSGPWSRLVTWRLMGGVEGGVKC